MGDGFPKTDVTGGGGGGVGVGGEAMTVLLHNFIHFKVFQTGSSLVFHPETSQ